MVFAWSVKEVNGNVLGSPSWLGCDLDTTRPFSSDAVVIGDGETRKAGRQAMDPPTLAPRPAGSPPAGTRMHIG